MRPKKTEAREIAEMCARHKLEYARLKDEHEKERQRLDREFEERARSLSSFQMGEGYALRRKYGHTLGPAAQSILERFQDSLAKGARR